LVRVKASGITADDQVLLEMQDRLKAADRRDRKQEAVSADKKRKARNKRQTTRRQEQRSSVQIQSDDAAALRKT
jgi:hypothetical protein